MAGGIGSMSSWLIGVAAVPTDGVCLGWRSVLAAGFSMSSDRRCRRFFIGGGE